MQQLANTKVNNLMAPAGGAPSLAPFLGIAPTTGFAVDWTQYQNSIGFPFIPQSVWIDNTAGTTPAKVVCGPLGYTITCPAGEAGAWCFPATTVNPSSTIFGDGVNKILVAFSDAPAIPQGAITAMLSGPVDVPVNVSGVPYQVSPIPGGRQTIVSTIAPAAVSATVTPPASTQVRELDIAVSANATLAAAGYTTLQIVDQVGLLYQEHLYFAAAAATAGVVTRIKLERECTGELTVSLSTALSAGYVDINAQCA